MFEDDDLIGRLRAAKPTIEAPHADAQRERILDRVHRDANPRGKEGRRMRWPAVFSVAAAAMIVSTGALAASGVEFPIVSDHAKSPAGVPLPRTAGLLKLRVADPDGGPDWGLRAYTTAQDAHCLDIGRVVDGRLGTLTAAGRFRETPLGLGGCVNSAPGRPSRVLGFGTSQAIVTRQAVAPGTADAACAESGRPVPAKDSCAPSDLRRVAYGVPSQLSTAYLVVLPGDASLADLRSTRPCERDGARLISAQLERCPQ